MSKNPQDSNKGQTVVEPTTNVGGTPPKKPRKKPINYTRTIESAYDPTKALTNQNPADRVVIPNRGAFKFDGLLIDTSPLGTLVRIPEQATQIKNPTLRQIVEILDSIYAPKSA